MGSSGSDPYETIARLESEVADLRERLAAALRDRPSKDDVKRERAIAVGLRFDVMYRDKFACTYCGAKGNRKSLRVDHVTPVSKGGKSTLANLTTACQDCNAGKSDKVIDADTVVVVRPKRAVTQVPIRDPGPPLSIEESKVAADAILAMLSGGKQ